MSWRKIEDIITFGNKLGLNSEEVKLIIKRLRRYPNELELFMFSAQWSEHCGYKHSKELLKKYFSNAQNENAGYINIDKYAVVFKVESHNHPSAVEPYQGAATGIGGIVRDILAMGARPIALLDSLKFGKINDPDVRHIFEGVVSGISGYGNSIGVPTIGGETEFLEMYKENPIVNVMCTGIAKSEELATSKIPENVLDSEEDLFFYYMGSKTGRDGIHGASFASKELTEVDARPSVQIGDPFTEKNLIESTLEILKLDGIYACQDMGAAGILSSTSEIGYKSGRGVEIYVDQVPLREENMLPYEILLSESQERMVFVGNKKVFEKLKLIAKKYMLELAIIGKIVNDNKYIVKSKNKIIAELPLNILVDAPSHYRITSVPQYIKNISTIPDKIKNEVNQKIDYSEKNIKKFRDNCIKLLKSENYVSKSWIWEQYDYRVQTSTVILPESSDSAILFIKGTNKGLALTIDSNPLQSYISPFQGAINTVFEAARNIIAAGGIYKGITDNLNFGNPEKDKIMWQFEESVKGIAKSSEILNIPVLSGNVSFYNETKRDGKIIGIYPAVVIGMIGEIENINCIMTLSYKNVNDLVYMVGKSKINTEKIGGSLFLNELFNFTGGEIDIVNFEFELTLHNFIIYLIKNKLVSSVHDLSRGGLFLNIIESCMIGKKGFSGNIGDSMAEIFGENQSVFVVSVPPEFKNNFLKVADKYSIPIKFLGVVEEKEAGINFGYLKFNYDEINKIYYNQIHKIMDE